MDDIIATAADGSTWYLEYQEVVKDMIEGEDEEDDKWQLPITREMVLDYVNSNPDIFEWELLDVNVPDCYDLLIHD